MLQMKNSKLILLAMFVMPNFGWAADAVNATPSNGIFKMVSGLAIVLIVMAAIAWAFKRLLPNIANNQQTVARVISSVSVGTRERVVVVQVADRWIVVGVAPGQVNGIANLEAGIQQSLDNNTTNNLKTHTQTLATSLAPSFSEWLQKSTAKFINKSSADNK
jgi:flagellar protein FliO/FliZ